MGIGICLAWPLSGPFLRALILLVRVFALEDGCRDHLVAEVTPGVSLGIHTLARLRSKTYQEPKQHRCSCEYDYLKPPIDFHHGQIFPRPQSGETVLRDGSAGQYKRLRFRAVCVIVRLLFRTSSTFPADSSTPPAHRRTWRRAVVL